MTSELGICKTLMGVCKTKICCKQFSLFLNLYEELRGEIYEIIYSEPLSAGTPGPTLKREINSLSRKEAPLGQVFMIEYRNEGKRLPIIINIRRSPKGDAMEKPSWLQ